MAAKGSATCDRHGPFEGVRATGLYCKPCNRERAVKWHAKPENQARVREKRLLRSEENNARRRELIAADPEYRAKEAARYRALRLEVLVAYGGRCACCGESEIDFLCMDHIDGGGNAHRRQLSPGGRGSAKKVYQWLRSNGYPAGFQVLCANCNMAKERPGGCPHQRAPLCLAEVS